MYCVKTDKNLAPRYFRFVVYYLAITGESGFPIGSLTSFLTININFETTVFYKLEKWISTYVYVLACNLKLNFK